jgi:ABC-type multidrug transport system permease subunit
VRKKVTIAVELIMEPSLFFLDEPTTGLDSAGAFAVLSAMQLLAKSKGLTVVCTIHQPSAELAAMFDQILLMKPGGEIAYFGAFKELPKWFQQHGLGEMQSGQNPADFALDQIKYATTGRGSNGNIAELYAMSELGNRVRTEIDQGIMPDDEKKAYVPIMLSDRQPSLLIQLVIMTERFFYSSIRNSLVIGIRYFLAIFMGLVVGTAFITLGYDQQYSDQRLGVLFVVLMFIMFTSNAFLPDIFFLRPIYFREQGSKMYAPLAFYLGRFISEIPFVVTEIIVLCFPVYFICDLNPEDDSRAFGLFVLTMVGVRWACIFFTWAVGTAIESSNNASTIQSTYFTLMMVLTGFILPGPSIPSWWGWFFDLSFLKYAMQFLIANETRNEQYYCEGTEVIPFSPVGLYPGITACPNILNQGPIPAQNEFFCYGVCTLSVSNSTAPRSWNFDTGCMPNYDCGKCRLACGLDTMDVYGVGSSVSDMSVNESVLWLFGVIFFIAGYVALRYINHIKR